MIRIELGGITESLPNTTFHVDIGNGHIILAHISGKLLHELHPYPCPGTRGTVQMSPYDFHPGLYHPASKAPLTTALSQAGSSGALPGNLFHGTQAAFKRKPPAKRVRFGEEGQ